MHESGLRADLGPRPARLLEPTPLAGAVSAYITVYWAARLVIQLTYLDRTDAPKGPILVVGETALVGVFLFLTLVYGALGLRALEVLGP